MVLPRLLALREAAEILGVSVFTIRRFVNAGNLKATRIGARVLISEAEVARALQFGVGESRKARKIGA